MSALAPYGRVPTFLDDWPSPRSRRDPDERLGPRPDDPADVEDLGGGLVLHRGLVVALELDDVLDRFDLAALGEH